MLNKKIKTVCNEARKKDGNDHGRGKRMKSDPFSNRLGRCRKNQGGGCCKGAEVQMRHIIPPRGGTTQEKGTGEECVNPDEKRPAGYLKKGEGKYALKRHRKQVTLSGTPMGVSNSRGTGDGEDLDQGCTVSIR